MKFNRSSINGSFLRRTSYNKKTYQKKSVLEKTITGVEMDAKK